MELEALQVYTVRHTVCEAQNVQGFIVMYCKDRNPYFKAISKRPYRDPANKKRSKSYDTYLGSCKRLKFCTAYST